MKALRAYLNQHLTISETDWEKISSKLVHFSATKRDKITTEGSIETNLYFVESGIVRLFFEDETKEITLNLGFPNQFICSYTSFLSQQPSAFDLESLTDCELYKLSKTDLELIYHETECGQRLGRILTEQLFLYLSKRETDFMLKSPTERYLALFDEQPHLIQEIPQKYLASYIGITPQALSRIRAKLVSGNS